MKMFISNSTHKVDRKGRVSVPATFRKVLEAEAQPGVVIAPTLQDRDCVEGYGYSQLEEIAASLAEMNPLSEEYEALATQVLGRARLIGLDPEGRVVLPAEFLQMARIEGEAVFVGIGHKFQIWNPRSWASQQDGMRGVARANLHKLPWGQRRRGPAPGDGGDGDPR